MLQAGIEIRLTSRHSSILPHRHSQRKWRIYIYVTIHAGRPYYLSFLKPIMASDSSSGFSHFWLGVSHILYRYAKYNRERGRKEQTNKHGLWLAPSARGGSLWYFLRILWANVSVYSSENSHKVTSNADLNSRVRQPCICRSTGPSSRLSDFC